MHKAISDREHLAKVRDCMRRVLSETDTESVIVSLQRFDSLSPSEIRTLTEMLRGPEKISSA